MKPVKHIEYIDGLPDKGIKVDWKLVKREYKKLNIPSQYHYPLNCDPTQCGYAIDMSDRSRGKTTNKLILGLILYRLYGIKMTYIRQSKNDVTKQNLETLYETVISCDYISKIFDDEFNSCFYYGHRWRLCRYNDMGELEEKAEDFFTFCCGLDQSDSLKSTTNMPTGDMIFFDEFISTTYGYSDFIRFSDICKTIIRDRISPIIFMSSNTINMDSQWFAEFDIQDAVRCMGAGDYQYIESEGGTRIFLEILGVDTSEKRMQVNKRFWGFNNPKLLSIQGDMNKGVWATDNYQRIPQDVRGVEVQTLLTRLYIENSGKIVRLRLVNHDNLGLCVYVEPAKELRPDSIVLTAGDIIDERYIFGFGRGTFIEQFFELRKKNKWYYARNAEGNFVKNYIALVKSTMMANFMT